MKKKLLLVEDEERLGFVLKVFFEKKNFIVEVVKDGEDAIFQAENLNPDIILLDWMLPNMSGLEICRQIRTSKDLKKTNKALAKAAQKVNVATEAAKMAKNMSIDSKVGRELHWTFCIFWYINKGTIAKHSRIKRCKEIIGMRNNRP